LIISTILNATPTVEQKQNYLHNLAKKANASAKKRSKHPSTKVRIRDVQVEKNYVLNLNYQGYLKHKKLIDKFRRIHHMKAKNKFCHNKFYKKMKDGLKINFSYYNQQNKLITRFCLDEKRCSSVNKQLNVLFAKRI